MFGALQPPPTSPAAALLAADFTPTSDALPGFKRASDVVPSAIVLPEVIIESLLHRGCKMVLAGGSKSFKSWSLIDLGLSVASGLDWWGLTTRKGNVLYLNFELLNGFFEQRLDSVCKARGMELPESFLFWTLRNHCYDLEVISRVLTTRAKAQGLKIDVIIVDPIYKALGGLSENDAGDMGLLMENIETLGKNLDAAVIFGAHFSKGIQSGKEAIDRMAGSGVFARDPDVIATMTRHEAKGSFVVETELRYLPDIPEFVVSWDFPIMRPDESKDPEDVFGKEGDKGKSKADFAAIDLFDLLPVQGLQDAAWKESCQTTWGRAGKHYYALKMDLVNAGKVKKQGNKYYPAGLRLETEETLPQPMPAPRPLPIPPPLEA
tara:strand:- start:23660 stop:24793 length:1134 start_codon:yes stop_codon:yes gene_type:complete